MNEFELNRPHPSRAIPTMLNLTSIGLLAGLSFCVQFGVVPALSRMDATAYLNSMQGIIPPFTQCVKPLMMIGLVTFIVRLLFFKPACAGARRWVLVSFLFFAAGAVITVAVHFPINDALMHFSPNRSAADLDPLRLRWNQFNLLRFAVAQLCLVAALVPFVFGRRPAAVSL